MHAGGEGPFGLLEDGREQFATAMGDQGSSGTFEYLLDCFYDTNEDKLRVVAGTKSGGGAAFQMMVDSEQCKLQQPIYSMQAGHSAVRNWGCILLECASTKCLHGKAV